MTTNSLMPPAGDVSVHLLNMIVGQGWTSWAEGSASGATAAASNVTSLINTSGSLVGSLMSGLSSVLLLVAAMILVYTYGTGAASAAHSGDHKINSMWLPLRQAFGIAALAPLPGLAGISVIVAMISFPIQIGIGAADNLASIGAAALVKTGGQVAPANPPIISPTAIKILFSNMVAQTYMSSTGWTVTESSQWSPDNSQLSVTFAATQNGATLPDGSLGSITIDCPGGSAPGLCGAGGAVVAGLASLVKTLAPAAAQIVTATNGYGTTAPPVSAGALQSAIQNYQTTIQTNIAQYAQQNNSALSQQLSAISDTVDSEGWASLPMLYYQISKYNNASQGVAAGLNLNVVAYNPSQLTTYAEFPAAEAMARNYENAAPLGDQINIQQANTAATGGTGNGSTTPGSGWFSSLNVFKIIAKGFMTALSSGTDPIADLQSASNWSLDTITTGYVASVGLKAAAAGGCEGGKVAANAANGFAGGLGAAVAGVEDTAGVVALCAANDALNYVMTAFSFLALPLIAALVVGAFYLPMAPAIMMSMAVLNWVSLVVELFIASILWAFSHVLPGGDNAVGEHSRDGYFILLDVCLRPALTVFGYFLAIAMIAVSAYFIVTGLSVAFDSINGGNMYGPISAISEIVITIGALYVAINHSIGLIHRVPQTAMRMLGRASGIDMGEEQSANNISGIVANRAAAVEHRASTHGGSKSGGGKSGGGNGSGGGNNSIAQSASKTSKAATEQISTPPPVEQVGNKEGE